MIRGFMFDILKETHSVWFVRYTLYVTLGVLGAGFHYLDFPNEVYYWLIENIYFEQVEYIDNGSGLLHWLYCKFIMISEGMLLR